MLKKTTLLFLLLSVLSVSINAQGVRHVNIAQGTVKLASSSGFSGNVSIPLASATVTVCTGSTLPVAGTVCTGLASIYVDIGLTGLLSNPTNADLNGNYSFYALGGLSYVVSVSSIGFTTQSYVWSAPLSGSSPTLTSPTITNPTTTGVDAGIETIQNKTLTVASSGNTVTLLNAQVNAAAVTGNGSAITFYTYIISANVVTFLKGIRLTAGWVHSTGTASVTYNLLLNGQVIASWASSNTAGQNATFVVLNTASSTATLTANVLTGAGSLTQITSLVTGLAWTSSQSLTLNFNVANTDAITPVQWLVELIQ